MSNLETLQNKKVCDLESDGMEIIEIVNVDENGLVKAENVCEDKTFHVAHIRIDDEKQFEVLTEFYVNYNDLDHKEENVDENALIVTENELQGRKEEKTENTLNSDDECILEAVEDTEENDLPTLKSITCLSRSNQENRQPVKAAKPSWTRRQKTNQESPTPCKICGKMTASRSMYLRHLLKFHCGLPSSSSMENNAKSHRRTRAKEIVCRASVVARPLAKKNTSQTDYDTSAINITAKTTGPSPSLNNANPAIDQTAHSENHLMSSSSTAETDETAFEENAYYALTSPDIPATSADEKYVTVNTRNHTKEVKSKVEEENTIIMCDACGKTFRFRSSYRKHVRYQHPEGSPPPRPIRNRRMCHFCGKLCSSSSFRGHMKKHTNPDCVTCKLCGMVFSFESVLKNHMKVRHSAERPYKCAQCESSFKRADYLRSHMRYKHEPKLIRAEENGHPFRCPDCDSCFKSKETYDKHRSMKSDVNGELRCTMSFQCDECETTFKKRNYLSLHKRYVHEEKKPFRISETSVGPYKCDRCDRRFASVCGRNYHCKSAHGTTYSTVFRETCDHCGLTFTNRVFYAKHCAKLREKPTCYLCWNVFDNDASLKQHMHDVHVDDLPFLCVKCNRRFVTLRQLTDHTRSRHANVRPFKCEMCPHTSFRKDSLEVHIRSLHLMEKPYACDLCDKKFSQKSDLKKHRVTHTRIKVKKEKFLFVSNIDENTLKTVQRQYRFQNSTATVQKPKTSRKRQKICDLCGKLCNTESGFRHHMNTHKDPRFTCDICGRAFREIQNLMKHKKTVHSDERPFQCDVCGSNYKRKDVLQEHIKRVHEGVRRSAVHGALKGKSRTAREKSFSKEYYQCPYCYKYLASKCYLDDHVNGMHTKEKIYRCDECDMSFTRKASIKYHKQRAHVEKKRILEPRGTFLKDCEYCGLQFRVQKYYEIHVAEKHENRHACQHCDVVCGTKFQLMEHTRTAHYDKLSFCTECNKSFHEEVYLKRHMYWVHLRKTVIECHHCSYKANKKSSMASHMRRHTGEKPYECDLCSRKFRQFVDFRKHRMNHFKNRITETSMVNVDSLIQYVIA